MSAPVERRSNPWIADLEWAREPRQGRGRRTQARLLDAFAQLLEDDHVDDVAIADIVAAAGSSVGAFYHHFADKQAAVYALLDRSAHEFHETTLDAVSSQRWHGATIADVVRGYLEFSLDVGRRRPGLRRAELAVALRDSAVRDRRAKLQRVLHDGVAELLTTRRDEIGHPDPTLAIAWTLDQLRALLDHRLDPSLHTSSVPPDDDVVFVDETLRSVTRYLELDPTVRTT